MRITVKGVCVEANDIQKLTHSPQNFGFRHPGMYFQRLGDRLSHRDAGIERAERVLKNDLHAPTKPSQLVLVERCDVDPVYHDFAGVRLYESKYRPRARGLAGAAFTHHPECLACRN